MNPVKKLCAIFANAGRSNRIEKQLGEIADVLPELIVDSRQKVQAFKDAGRGQPQRPNAWTVLHERCLDETAPFSIKGLGRYDTQALSDFEGYRRIHEICAAENVHVYSVRLSSSSSIVLHFGAPYKGSTDENCFRQQTRNAPQVRPTSQPTL